MSEPKRYQPVVQCVEPSYQAQMIEPKVVEFSEGEYVRYEDYARLKAEVERLSKKEDYQHDLLNQYAEDVERLKSELQMEKENEDRLVRLHQDARNEVERLTKAGDAMMGWIDYQHDGSGYQHSRVWEAAKGVQS